MKKITVEVPDGQHRYIQEFARTLGLRNEGDFLLVMAMTAIAYADGDEEGAVGTFLAGQNEFLVKRRIPTMEPSDFMRYGVQSRPASAFKPESQAQAQALFAGS